MLVNAIKRCDSCGTILAEKKLLFFRTKIDYVTVRVDEVDYCDATIDGTIVNKQHYCKRCWRKITDCLTED